MNQKGNTSNWTKTKHFKCIGYITLTAYIRKGGRLKVNDLGFQFNELDLGFQFNELENEQ